MDLDHRIITINYLMYVVFFSFLFCVFCRGALEEGLPTFVEWVTIQKQIRLGVDLMKKFMDNY